MRRWAARFVLLFVLSGSGYVLGGAAMEARPAATRVEVVPRAPSAISLTAFRQRAHPRGLDADDAPRWQSNWGTAWKGGGRHPVWRGCRHVYDPTMTAFLNTPSSVDLGSGT